MKKAKKYLIIWYISIFSFMLSIAVFIYGMFNTEGWIWLLCAVLLLIFVILYVLSERNLKIEGDATIPDAIHFYKSCKKAENNSKHGSKSYLDIAKEYDYSAKLSPRQVKTLYYIGKNNVDKRKRNK